MYRKVVTKLFSVHIAQCKLECLAPTLTRFLVLLAWLRAAMLSQLIFPATFSTRKNWAMAIATVWKATNPNSLPLYDPAFGEISMNEPRRVRQQAVHTIIHPDLLTMFAFSLSYDPSVTARNVLFTSAFLIHSMLILPWTICSHIHSLITFHVDNEVVPSIVEPFPSTVSGISPGT